MPTTGWDIARDPFTCAGGKHIVGQGEAYRISKVPGRIGHCEDCSIRLFEEPAPAHVDERTFEERLRDDARLAPAPREKAGPVMPAHVSQPSFDPRGGARYQRHGVVERIRETTTTDWRRRAAGGRDE